jgi:hypothetical protein
MARVILSSDAKVLFHFSSIKFIFRVIIEKLLDAAMWLKVPKG